MGRVSPACTVGAAEGTGGCCPSTTLRPASVLALTAAAIITTLIVRTIILAPLVGSLWGQISNFHRSWGQISIFHAILEIRDLTPVEIRDLTRGAHGNTPDSCMQDTKTTRAGWRYT